MRWIAALAVFLLSWFVAMPAHAGTCAPDAPVHGCASCVAEAECGGSSATAFCRGTQPPTCRLRPDVWGKPQGVTSHSFRPWMLAGRVPTVTEDDGAMHVVLGDLLAGPGLQAGGLPQDLLRSVNAALDATAHHLEHAPVAQVTAELTPHSEALRHAKIWTLHLLCDDGSRESGRLSGYDIATWGEGRYLEAVLDGVGSKGRRCLASFHRPWAGASLDRASHWTVREEGELAQYGAFLASLTKPEIWRPIAQAMGDRDRATDVLRRVAPAHLRFLQARLPGRRFGLAYLAVVDEDGRGPVFHGVFTVDGKGRIVDTLVADDFHCGARSEACTRLLALGDVDGDGAEDLFLDARSAEETGAFELVTWRGNRMIVQRLEGFESE